MVVPFSEHICNLIDKLCKLSAKMSDLKVKGDIYYPSYKMWKLFFHQMMSCENVIKYYLQNSAQYLSGSDKATGFGLINLR